MERLGQMRVIPDRADVSGMDQALQGDADNVLRCLFGIG